MRLIITLIACAIVARATLCAEDTQFGSIDIKNERDRKLYAFCQGAILRDRGLACSPFAGSSDKWIVEKLVPEDRFLAALDASKAMSGFAAPSVKGRLPEPDHRSKRGILTVFQQKDINSEKLVSKLTLDQRERLPGVYLHLEGCFALCRPEFMQMFDNADAQERIRQLTEEVFRDRAAPLHRALFGLRDADEAPIYQAELRRIAADLDCRIVHLMSERERERLLNLITMSGKMNAVVHGSPSF